MSRESEFSHDPIETVKEVANNGLHKAATVIHDNAGRLGGGRAASTAHRVADGIDSTAAYLKDHDISDMGNDVMNVCRKYPAQAILSSLAIGFLLGRVLRR